MNGIILVNKPSGYTSHDIVGILRKKLKTKKVGHCGTLDPDATGVLVVCVNKATKAIQFLTADDKEYIATLSLGTSTDTYDASGKVIESKEVQPIKKEQIENVLKQFVGFQKQMPPMYSAIKVNGKKLYEYARAGEEVKVEPRSITIHDIQLLDYHDHLIKIKVSCSKGTYIRSLCVDIAQKLGYPGHMAKLIRTCSGDFKIEQCATLEEIEAGDFNVITLDEALKCYPQYVVEDENIVFHGKKIKSDLTGMVAIYNKEGHVLAMYQDDGQGYLKNVRGLW